MLNPLQKLLHRLSAPDEYWRSVKSMANRCLEYDKHWDQIPEGHDLKWGKDAFDNRFIFYIEDYAEGLEYLGTKHKNWKWDPQQYEQDCKREYERKRKDI